MFFKSIRFKLLLWYILFLTVTLLAFGAILYGTFVKILYDDFDDLLSSRAEGVADSINTYWHMEKTHASKDANYSGAIDTDNFIKIAHGWVEEKRKDPDLMSVFVRILNAKGEVMVSSKSMPRIENIPKDDFADVLDGDDSFDTVKGELPAGKKTKFRSYTKPVMESGKVEYIVQVVGPMGLVSLALNNLMFVLFILIPLTIILAATPGVILARVTLKPVDRMIDTLRRITTENLKLRIHLPDTKDEIKRLADTFNDMIDRLERSFSSQQRFIQDISEDLKEPMKSLKEELDTALGKNFTEGDRKTILTKASKEIERFSGIIDNLLILSGLENDQMALEIRKVNLTRLIGQALNDAKKNAEEKEIAVSFSSPGTIILDGDEKQIRLLFLNLLDNAVRYTNRKGNISVSASKDEKNARIAVSDTGTGIPEDEIPYIFDRFYQIRKSRPGRQGFGLGLSSVKSIIEEHKGSITVESECGKGSTFTVLLPLSYPG